MPAADNTVVFVQLIRPQVPPTVRLLQVRQFAVQDLLAICDVVLMRMLHCCLSGSPSCTPAMVHT